MLKAQHSLAARARATGAELFPALVTKERYWFSAQLSSSCNYTDVSGFWRYDRYRLCSVEIPKQLMKGGYIFFLIANTKSSAFFLALSSEPNAETVTKYLPNV